MFKRFTMILLAFFFSTSPAFPAEPEVVKLAEGVYGFIGEEGVTNSGFVVTGEGVVVIDTQGPKDLALLLKKRIREITDKPVLYVINTHFHGDHTFGNQYFKEAKEIISHENTKINLLTQLQSYLMDLQAEVKRYLEKGKGVDEMKKEISLPKYKNWSRYNEWLPFNAEKVYKELENKTR